MLGSLTAYDPARAQIAGAALYGSRPHRRLGNRVRGSGRKTTWQAGLPVVVSEEGTQFQSVAAIADATSMVANWGTEGVQFINTDITLALARPPVSHEIGLSATDRVERDGIAVGTVEVFDRAGPLGTAMATSLANTARPVNFENAEFDDEGNRTKRR